jgi:FAD/FMN-containing dehydrogenase
MNAVHSIEPSSGILYAQAGCTLHELHDYASQRGHLFPLDIGSKGTCQIGGNVSTNAGGQYYYRWGGLHANVVGLEVVLPDGRVLRLNMPQGRRDPAEIMDNSAASLGGCHRKDNTGYDLKHLFIGAEGTLGVITEVAVACPPLPTSKHALMLVCDSYSAVLEVLAAAKQELGETLSAMELMDWQTLTQVRNSLGVARGSSEALLLDEMLDTNDHSTTVSSPPLSQSTTTLTPLYLLVETQGSNSEHDASKMDSFLTRLYESSTIRNGFLATDSKRIHALWNIREACNPAVARSGYVYKYDVSVPIEEYMDVAAEVKESLSNEGTLALFPETAVCVWGHLADGNAHINVVTPGNFHKDESLASHVDDSVYGSVLRRRGSISAEHGIGQSKNEILGKIKDRSVMDVMVQLKQLFDPHGIMNPGKVLPSDILTQSHDQSK